MLVGWVREKQDRDTGCVVLPVGKAGRECHRPWGALWPRGSAGGVGDPACEQLTGCARCSALPCLGATEDLGTLLELCGSPVCARRAGCVPQRWVGGHPWVTLAQARLWHQQCPLSPALSGVPGVGEQGQRPPHGSRCRDTSSPACLHLLDEPLLLADTKKKKSEVWSSSVCE